MQYNFANLINIDKVRALSSSFFWATGIPSTILGLDGTVFVGSGHQKICTNFHRAHPQTLKRCRKSDSALFDNLNNGLKISVYECLNGLTDAAAPIIIEGEHLANLFAGPFLYKKPDMEFFCKQARSFYFDEHLYLEALKEVPIIHGGRIKPVLNYLSSFAEFIGEIGLKQLKLQEALENIKTLKGMLPICSSCKKIRDDKGYWNQIETYIRDHSDAEFSHSLCPVCTKKLYPDLFKNNKPE